MISGKPVVAVTVNHEGIERARIDEVCRRIEGETGLPTVDPLVHGCGRLVAAIGLG